MEKNLVGFGPHLIVDLWGITQEICDDLKLIFDYLNQVPEIIEMHKITQPYVFPYSGLFPEDCGITGQVTIAESHFMIHTFSKKGYIFLDIFSCKPFNVDLALKEIITRFQPKDYKYWVVERGLNFPHTLI